MLTVLLLIIWIGSVWWGYVVIAYPTGTAGVALGRLSITWRDPVEPIHYWASGSAAVSRPRMIWWFRFGATTPYIGSRTRGIEVPLWTVSLLVGVPAGLLWYRDRRRAPGLCRKCGYDLRGADHSLCPECGAAVPEQTTLGTA